MTIINLKKYYYPLVKTDVFVEVPDEIADALLHLRREENNRKSKMFYHKAYFSLDCEDGIENYAIGWEQPSPEQLMIQAEGISPTQASDSARAAVKRLQKYFKKKKWLKENRL